jgi:hypothetical protein
VNSDARVTSRWLSAALVLALACSGGTEGDGEVPDGPDAPPPVAGDGGPSVVALPEGGGSGTVSGSADGMPFTTVATSYLIGAPDSANTTVVFVFSKPVGCGALAAPGWDARIADATQFLEMKIFGKEPGTFKAVTTVTPAPGETSVNYTLSSTTSLPKEIGSGGGTVTLTTIALNGTASGTFALSFGAGSLNGTFNSIFCPGGHEP